MPLENAISSCSIPVTLSSRLPQACPCVSSVPAWKAMSTPETPCLRPCPVASSRVWGDRLWERLTAGWNPVAGPLGHRD